jgi:hypothetical protein
MRELRKDWSFFGLEGLQKTDMNTFHEDLERGKAIERKTLEVIRKKYPSASLIEAFKGYDIWIPELHKSVEVKYDPMSNETGNIVVEIEMNGKASALITTTADFWLFYDDHVFMLMKPMSIVNLIFQLKLQYKEFVGNGDRSSKKAFLVPKEKLFQRGITLEVCK